MRYKVRTHEIGHLWAHQSQDRADASNMSFNGVNFRSYQACIASIVTNKKGDKAYLLSSRKWSVTTSQHQSDVRSAIPNDAKIIYCLDPTVGNGRMYVPVGNDEEYDENKHGWMDDPEGKHPDHNKNLEYWRGTFDGELETANKSREPKKTRLMQEAAATLEQMREYAAFFGLKKVKYPKMPVNKDELASLIETRERQKAKAEAARKKRIEEQNKEKIAEAKEYMHDWLVDPTVRYNDYFRFLPTELRIVGDEIETSRGARFPVTHAKRGLALVESVIARGEEWRRNGQTCKLGFYQIDNIEANGTVHAGCHTVPYAAIARVREAIVAFVAVAEESEVA
jgi:hypothetical protein